MQRIDEIQDQCQLRSIPATELVVQIDVGSFFIYTPDRSNLFVTCESTERNGNSVIDKIKEKHIIEGYVAIHMNQLCRGSLPQHVFSTGTDM